MKAQGLDYYSDLMWVMMLALDSGYNLVME